MIFETTTAAFNKCDNIFPGQITIGIISKRQFPDQQRHRGLRAGWSPALHTLTLRAVSDWLKRVLSSCPERVSPGQHSCRCPSQSSALAQKTAPLPVSPADIQGTSPETPRDAFWVHLELGFRTHAVPS